MSIRPTYHGHESRESFESTTPRKTSGFAESIIHGPESGPSNNLRTREHIPERFPGSLIATSWSTTLAGGKNITMLEQPESLKAGVKDVDTTKSSGAADQTAGDATGRPRAWKQVPFAAGLPKKLHRAIVAYYECNSLDEQPPSFVNTTKAKEGSRCLHVPSGETLELFIRGFDDERPFNVPQVKKRKQLQIMWVMGVTQGPFIVVWSGINAPHNGISGAWYKIWHGVCAQQESLAQVDADGFEKHPFSIHISKSAPQDLGTATAQLPSDRVNAQLGAEPISSGGGNISHTWGSVGPTETMASSSSASQPQERLTLGSGSVDDNTRPGVEAISVIEGESSIPIPESTVPESESDVGELSIWDTPAADHIRDSTTFNFHAFSLPGVGRARQYNVCSTAFDIWGHARAADVFDQVHHESQVMAVRVRGAAVAIKLTSSDKIETREAQWVGFLEGLVILAEADGLAKEYIVDIQDERAI